MLEHPAAGELEEVRDWHWVVGQVNPSVFVTVSLFLSLKIHVGVLKHSELTDS